MPSTSSDKKRGSVTGFDGVRGSMTMKRVANWNKNQPSGRWRKIKQFKIRYTYIHQRWLHLDQEYERTHITPFGMKEFMKDLLQKERNSNKKAIPLDVKEALGLTNDENFDQNDLKLVCEDDGDKGFDTFLVLYCEDCVKQSLPWLAKRFSSQLPDSPTITDLQDSWDELFKTDPSIAKDVDLCGTVLPNNPTIIAGPNNRRFILRPVDHADKNKSVHNKEPAAKRPLPTPPASAGVTIEVPAKKSALVKTYTQATKSGRTADGKKVSDMV